MKIIEARTLDDFKKVISVRSEALGDAKGVKIPITDSFDKAEDSINILAISESEDKAIGAMRINIGNGRLPIDRYFNTSLAKRDIANEYVSETGEFPVFSCASYLAVSSVAQGSPVLHKLLDKAVEIGMLQHVTHIFALVDKARLRMWRKIGYKHVTESFYSERIGRIVYPCVASFAEYKKLRAESKFNS